MIRDYKTTIAAGSQSTFGMKGTFIAFARASEDVRIRVKAFDENGAEVVAVQLMQGEKVPASRPFNQITLQNENNKDVEVTIIAGSGSFQSDRQAGEVSIIGAVAIDDFASIRGNRFIHSAYRQQPETEYSFLEYRNPLNSGVNVVIRRIRFRDLSETGRIRIWKLKTQVAMTGEVSASIKAENSNEPSQLKYGSQEGLTVSTYTDQFELLITDVQPIWDGSLLNSANGSEELNDFIMMQQGESLIVENSVIGQGLMVYMAFEEIAANE